MPRRRARRNRRRAARKSRLGLFTALGLIALIGIYAWVLDYSRPHVDGTRLRFDTFVQMVADGRVRDATVLDEDAYVVGTYGAPGADATEVADPSLGDHHGGLAAKAPTARQDPVAPFRIYNAPLVRGTQAELLQLLLDNGVPITINQQVGKRVAALASLLLPGLIIVVLFIYLILSYRRGSGLFGIRSGARRIRAEETKVTFADVAGQDAAVIELREIKEFLADPERFAALGATVPKGVLLYGPPGCGKTLMAKALAGEAGASFFSISGSDFVEVFVGVGAARVRDLFREAREHTPALIFIDELDSIGRARGVTGTVASHGEQEQSLNQILAEMDGFSTSEGIIVVAATNRPDILDPALLRPGRFDRTVGLERPTEADRRAILALHAQNKQLEPGVDLVQVAHRAIGLTGADLASVLNEGALLAGRARRPAIAQSDLTAALQRILEEPDRQRRLSLHRRSIGTRYATEDRATFAEVAGADEAVAELSEIAQYLADPDRYAALGAQPPRGVLLSGPPGCGKTLLARAVAGEANAAFISVAASQFVEVWVGEGASRVRELFAEARSVAPSIVFIDELDGLGVARGMTASGGERDQTLNQLLVELDGFDGRGGLIVMAATNRPDILDSALVRPGRFDRQVMVQLPDRQGRQAILALHARGKALGADVDLDKLAALTRGFSGADLANVLNEAALLAARRGRAAITMQFAEEGIERARLGVSSRATIVSDDERRVVAYHEAGHALVARALPGADPPHRLTVAPTASTLGHCTTIDQHDRVVVGRSRMLDRVATLLGGWAAERLVFGETTSACSSDLERAERLARHMVADLGMSERLGPRVFGRSSRDGRPSYSEDAARIIDDEVDRVIEEARTRSETALDAARELLDRAATALLERESLTADELELLASVPDDLVPPKVG
ncbi:MAG TPA: AAA family ATPase [Acidimicrobiales bacterium]|nr:AAA family ATPase [Acidimicrobiales bacterium]